MDVCEQETIAQLFDKQKSILAAKRMVLLASHLHQPISFFVFNVTHFKSHLKILFDSHPGKRVLWIQTPRI